MGSGREGILYEQEVNKKLKKAKLQPPGFVHDPNDNVGRDSVFIRKRSLYGIEVKHTYSTTYGSMGLMHNGRKWVLKPPDSKEDPLLYDMLRKTEVESAANQLYKNRGVPFLFQSSSGRNALTPQQIAFDVETFRGSTSVDIPVASAFKYYSSKDVDYFQIKDFGFYYIDDNPADVGCSKLKINRMVAEIRMKTDKKPNGTVYYRFAVSMKAVGIQPTKSINSIDGQVNFLY
jgi:hypothetical protein